MHCAYRTNVKTDARCKYLLIKLLQTENKTKRTVVLFVNNCDFMFKEKKLWTKVFLSLWHRSIALLYCIQGCGQPVLFCVMIGIYCIESTKRIVGTLTLACQIELKPADVLFQPHRLCSQVAFLGKLLASASQSYKSCSGHLWMFSKHRGKLRECVCAYMHNRTSGHERFLEAMLPSSSFSRKREEWKFVWIFSHFLLCSFFAWRLFQIRQRVSNLAVCNSISDVCLSMHVLF